jgi:hypothetical protein
MHWTADSARSRSTANRHPARSGISRASAQPTTRHAGAHPQWSIRARASHELDPELKPGVNPLAPPSQRPVRVAGTLAFAGRGAASIAPKISSGLDEHQACRVMAARSESNSAMALAQH